MKQLTLLLVCLTIGFWSLGLAQAAEFRTDSAITSVVASSEKPTDLYIANRNVTVNSPVQGDLVVAGDTIIVNGAVSDSMFVAGGTVDIKGNVGRHLRVAGGTVTLRGKVGGDLFVAGGTVTLESTAVVNGGLYATGGTIIVDGTVNGEFRASGGTITVNGTTGPAQIYGATTVSQSATIHGNLTYHAPSAGTIVTGAHIDGKTDFIQTTTTMKSMAMVKRLLSFIRLIMIIGTILVGALFVRLRPRYSQMILDQAMQHTAAALGWGLLVFVVTPIIIGLLLVTVVGIPLAIIIASILFPVLILGSLFGQIALGAWLHRLVVRTDPVVPSTINLPIITIGIIVGGLLWFVPFIGGVIAFFLFLIGLGAIAQVMKNDAKNAPSQG